jgi:hypothetical protein
LMMESHYLFRSWRSIGPLVTSTMPLLP